MRVVVEAQAAAPVRGRLARFIGASPLTAAARRSYRDALGELVVGDVLDGLGQRWDVLHDLPLDAHSTLEHLVMGPAGTFAVRTANYRDLDVIIDGDILLAGGEPRDDIEVCIEQADAAADALTAAAGSPVPVQALLVVVAPRRLTVRREPSGVRVAASGALERILKNSPRRASGEDVARVSDLADLESSWPAASELHADTHRLNREFAGVRAEVRSALLTKAMWGIVGFAIAYGILWALVARLVTSMVGT